MGTQPSHNEQSTVVEGLRPSQIPLSVPSLRSAVVSVTFPLDQPLHEEKHLR